MKIRDQLRLKHALLELFRSIRSEQEQTYPLESFRVETQNLADFAGVDFRFCAACDIATVLADFDFIKKAGSWIVASLDEHSIQFNRCSPVLVSLNAREIKAKSSFNRPGLTFPSQHFAKSA